MKKINNLPIFSNLIIGADCMCLLDAIIELHNQYVKEFQKQTGSHKIKWYGGMRLSINDLCIFTGLKKDKAITLLKKLWCEGIKYCNHTFIFLDNVGQGYYKINVDELDFLEKCVCDYMVEWHRNNDNWEKKNTSKLFSIDNIMEALAKENLNLLETRFRNKL